MGDVVSVLHDIPERDGYTGVDRADSGATFTIDVAVAPSWMNCVRLSLDECDAEQRVVRAVETLLNPAEVELLIRHLQEAAADIKRRNVA